MTHLVAASKDVKRVLALQNLLNDVRDDVAHREADVPAHHFLRANGSAFSYSNAVERPDDHIRKLMLVPGGASEVFGGQFLESIRRLRRRDLQFRPLRAGELGRGLEDHRRAEHHDPLEGPLPMRGQRRIERRSDDPLVLSDQVVCVRVEIGDPSDHRCAGDEVVTTVQQLRQQRNVLGIALDLSEVGVVVVRPADPSVLREVVEPDEIVAPLQQFLGHIATDEAGRSGKKSPSHERRP